MVQIFVIVDTPTALRLLVDLARVVAPNPWPRLMLACHVNLSKNGVQHESFRLQDPATRFEVHCIVNTDHLCSDISLRKPERPATLGP